ncbi:MAG: InlB B-repeat-containing protein, partial [Spirochaetaceae bacterium]|nr:InlB B-repeat-containing protein [Spirochaetaceae bacterium]
MKTITKNLLIVVAMITTVMIIGCPHNSPKPEPEYKEPARYTVSFHKNDTNAKGSMDPQTFVEGVEQKLTPNLFDLTNHEFKGWALTPEGDKKYIDQQSITVSSDMTLYAVWEQKICTITFEKNADDAVGSMNSQQ